MIGWWRNNDRLPIPNFSSKVLDNNHLSLDFVTGTKSLGNLNSPALDDIEARRKQISFEESLGSLENTKAHYKFFAVQNQKNF